MIPTLRFSKNDTRESTLAKAAIWYDNIVYDKVAKFATAMGQADVSCDDMMAVIDQGRLMAAEGRAPFLAEVGRALDEVIANRAQAT